MSKTAQAVKLNVMIGEHPTMDALKQGKVKSDLLDLNIYQFKSGEVAHDLFKRVVAGEFDVAELAIMTFVQAISYGRPLVALPVAVHGRFQHPNLIYNADRGVLAPKDLEGKRVSSRTYSQTTPTWVRGILQNDYGVDIFKIQYTTFEDGHVPDFKEPPNVQRGPKGKKALQMLLDGEIDAAVTAGDDLKHPKVKPVIPDPAAAGRDWHARTGALMVNHVVVAKSSLSQSNPEAVREIYRLLKESRAAANEPAPKDGVDKRPIGFSANRRNFEIAAQYSERQRLLGRPLKLEDMFDATTRALD
jgi:4,5-dihydroxyphthalate decarboxylase